VSVEGDKRSGRPSIRKTTKNVEKIWELDQWKLSLNNPWACRHHWGQLWSLPGDLNITFEHAPHCSFIMTTSPPTHPWKPQSLWLTTTWLLFPILPACRT
jgi:hypothetical protein